jgi:hypothetical protein
MRRRFLVAGVVLYASLVAALVVGPQVLAKRAPIVLTTCTGTIAHATTSDITVPEGAVCRVTASTVNGNVTVQDGAYFEAAGTKVYGNLKADRALTVFLHDGTSVSGTVQLDRADQLFLYKTTVEGAVKVTNSSAPGYGHIQVCQSAAGSIDVRGSGPDVLIGDPDGGCPGNVVGADLVVESNDTAGQLQVSGNTVKGSLLVSHNTGTSPKNVVRNAVQGTIDLSDNTAPFAASANG